MEENNNTCTACGHVHGKEDGSCDCGCAMGQTQAPAEGAEGTETATE